MTEQAPSRVQAWRAVGIFLVLTFALSGLFQALAIGLGSDDILLVTAEMWSPGLAALLTCRLLGRPLRSLPWGWGRWRYILAAWALPLGYCLLAYGLVWVLGLGGVPNPQTVAGWARQLGLEQAPTALVLLTALPLIGVVGVVDKLSRALGEEIGWRGFLVPELRKLMPFWAVGLVSGLIWSLWHWPSILGTDYNAGPEGLLFQTMLFTIDTTASGIVYAYFTLRSGSLWPAALLHASHNLFVQRIFTPLTEIYPDTRLWVDEFGILLPIASVALAVVFLLRARKQGL